MLVPCQLNTFFTWQLLFFVWAYFVINVLFDITLQPTSMGPTHFREQRPRETDFVREINVL